MNPSSNSLTFDLIKTLEPTEKAYIKKQFSANEKNLKLLFDDLNKTKVYNKDIFKTKHKSKAYINHLSQNKTYLRKKIIDALINYNTKSIPQINQRNELNVINILIHKGLLNQAVKLIEQGLRKNEHLEQYMQCYELCSLITNLSVDQVGYRVEQEILSGYKQKKRFYIKQLSLIEKFTEFIDIYYAQISNEQKVVALNKKLEELNLDQVHDPPDDYPFYAKRMFYFTKDQVASLQNNSITTISLLEKCVNLYFEYPQFLKMNPTPFLTDSKNFLDGLFSNKLYNLFFDKYEIIVDKIEEFFSKSKFKNDFITSYYVIKYYFYQLACSNSKQYKKAFDFSNEYLRFIDDQKNLSDKFLAASRIAIAVAYLNVQRFEESIDIITPIQSTKLYQYQYELRLIQILAHYKLGNDLVLDSLFDSFIYYLKKMEKLDETKAVRVLKKCIEKQNFDDLENVEFDELLSLNVKFCLTNRQTLNQQKK